MDGKGYHRGLTADQLPQAARILAVADMYEALSARRPYRQDMTEEQVKTIMEKNAGEGLCPETLAALDIYLAVGGYVPATIAA
jgi:HD-GYP domain-containing protein (c-di-GMP phosphodiesterase class II)